MGLLIRGRDAVTAAGDQLRAALQDASPTVRVVAARALGQYGTADDLQAALPVLGELARARRERGLRLDADPERHRCVG